MNGVFVDTGAWFARFVPTDPDDAAAKSWLDSNTQPLVTTDYGEFGHPSSCRSEQLVRTLALKAARRSDTELIERIGASA
jgi:predicted nucleic acid-binding protein